MQFDLRTRHTFSNKYVIEEWEAFDDLDMLGFVLSNKNEIYFEHEQIRSLYGIKQRLYDVRSEIVSIVLNDINEKLAQQALKVESIVLVNSKALGGYYVGNLFTHAYVKNIDEAVCEAFFDHKENYSNQQNNVESLVLELEVELGKFVTTWRKIVKGNVFKLIPNFRALHGKTVMFDFLLGQSEIMVVKRGDGMNNIEETIGEPVLGEHEDIQLELTVSLGNLEMSVDELRDLFVGDFIDVAHLSFPNIQIQSKQKIIATGELVYNEEKQLSIEIKEVLL